MCLVSHVSLHFQILLAIGGWAFGSTPFKELTSNTFRMNQFVYEAIDFLREYKFDGLDVDWEYPRYFCRVFNIDPHIFSTWGI